MNKSIIAGNITRDIEVKYTNTGKAIAKSGIAMNEYYTDAKGARVQRTDFIDVVAYGRTAEVMNQYCRKGSRVLIEGKLNLEQWRAQDGTARSRHVVQITSLELLDAKRA